MIIRVRIIKIASLVKIASLCAVYDAGRSGHGRWRLEEARGIQQGLDSMRTALRVLTAVVEKRNPDAADLEELHRLAPSLSNASPDVLACYLIQQGLKRRAEVRWHSMERR